MSSERPASAALEDKLAQKTAEVRILQQVSTVINSTLNLDEILDIVLGTMDDLFGFSHSILLLDDSEETLSVVASHGYEEDAIGAKVPVGTGLIGVVAKKRRMMRLGNLGQRRAYHSTVRSQMEPEGQAVELGEPTKLPGLPNVESQIAIPLVIKDKLIGVFSVESEEHRVFSERDEILITIVANQAASAIHNAQLYRAEEERRKELAQAHERLKLLNETLEDRVRERTEALQKTNIELRETQAQLFQSAKMASLGDLVAGVAHEFNTPLGSIHANADVAKRATTIVTKALESEDLTDVFPRHPKLEQALEALREATSTTHTASNRLVGIVKSLRSFARLDEAERKKADLHEGIDSTLTLLRHKLKDGVEVVKNYGDLEDMECFPNRLNQVFMNVLVNAIQAMDGRGTITITTRRDGDSVVLEFADTGRGIPEGERARVFDPGFTTKGVGVGTGLGLSISYRIIEEHNGTIDVSSKPGKGSVFTIRLPVC